MNTMTSTKKQEDKMNLVAMHVVGCMKIYEMIVKGAL